VTEEASTFLRFLGVEEMEKGEGWAKLVATVGPQHLNFHGYAHGSFIYALADEAFALACNSRGPAVGRSTTLEFFLPVRQGARLEAVAREAHLGRRTSSYLVEVRSEEGLVALFLGTAYRLGERGAQRLRGVS
jgi:acyl-CoA thioesterase